MPIANYVNPGVYVTQAPSPIVNTVSTSSLNILFLGYTATPPTNTQTDVFPFTSSSGVQTFTLSQSGTISNFTLTNNITGVTIASGTYTGPTTVSGVTTFTTISGATFVTNQTYLSASYTYTTVTTGNIYAFTDYNSVQNLFGAPFTYTGSTPQINSPCTLAAFLAFQNGAPQVSCMNITAVASGATSDFLTAVQNLAGIGGIDVIVPLVYDSAYNTYATGPLFKGMSLFLNAQANNGVYQRGFVGMDSTVPNLTNVAQTIDSDLNSTRMTLVAPNVFTYNPGFNSSTGLTTGTVNIPGYYAAAAVAGLFTGQAGVYVPITNKVLNGFTGIPGQVNSNVSTTVQSYGTTMIRQERNGNLVVRHGLTTNTTNYLTQEISINAIGDYLANMFKTNLKNTSLIGSPLTSVALGALNSLCTAILNTAQKQGLIQGYQALTIAQSQSNPTLVNVTFQYSPTLPLNYINVTLSINNSTGSVLLLS